MNELEPLPQATTPIAIIGMASMFAQARTLDEYWDNIVQARDCISEVPLSHWDGAAYFDPNPATPDKTYCRRGGFLPDLDFDPVEFGLPPNILEVTDVSQLLALLAARDTFDDAGYGAHGRPFDRERVGVVLGIGGGQKLMTTLANRLQAPVWERALQSAGLSPEETQRVVAKIKAAYVPWEENAFPGLLGNVIAGRIANRFDLGGMNCVVDAACAASLAAVKMAISELSERRCDMMLTGGVDTDNSIFMYMCFSKTPAFSSQDAPRPFDVGADGMMIGEGLGLLLLKRLEDAERDGDRIYAVIRGIGTSSDGRAKSIYAPRPEGQARALRRAYADARIPPASLGLIEAHGTGTVAGDLCEVSNLVETFQAAGAGQGSIALGSVKSQIGHTKAAAGAAGLIKAALALHQKVLPPTLNVTTPNPKFGLQGSPFYVNTETRPWLRNGTPRRAGISAFGFGGTNYHIVLEEHQPEHQHAYRLHAAPHEILLWAATPQALHARCAMLAEALASDKAAVAFRELCREAAATPVPPKAPRLGFVAADPTEAHTMLQLATNALADQPEAAEWTHPRGLFFRGRSYVEGVKVAALFPGQGAQHVGMGRELALNFPEVRQAFERLDALFRRDGQPALSQVVLPPPAFAPTGHEQQAAALQQTEYAQPAIGALSAGMYRLLVRAGFTPDAVAGHSFGEVTALWAAGALTDEDYDSLIRARGRAMRPLADPTFDAGTMVAVSAGEAAVAESVQQIPGLVIANYNGPEQLVLAGPRAAVAEATRRLAARGVTTTALPVAAAFHTPLVQHAYAPFAEAVRAARVQPIRLPVYANTTARPYPSDPAQISAQLGEQLLRPVYFHQQIEAMYADGVRVFVEIGPRGILTGLVRRILGQRPHLAVAVNGGRGRDSDRQLREAVVQLRVAGLPLGVIDAYRYERPLPSPKKRALVVRLNGSNYVSERTRAAYAATLNDGFQITRTAPVAATRLEQKSEPMPDATSALASSPLPAPAPTPVVPPLAGLPVSEPLSLAAQLAQLAHHQRELLQLQQLYLTHQGEYVRASTQLLIEQQRLLLEHGPQVAPATLDYLERSMGAFHQHQAETLRLHEQYLAGQNEYAQRLLHVIERLGVTAKGPLGPAVVAPDLTPVLHGAVSPNGHSKPADMITIEPHPGPDAPVAPPPAAPLLTPAVPAPVPGQAASVEQRPAPVAPPSAPLPAPSAAPAADGALVAALLDVVTELTGYPRETLELSMDMEGDLGIDSIKRVQILGAMQERFTALPAFQPEALAELRTLGQVVAHIRPHLPGPGAPAGQLPALVASVPTPAVPAPTPGRDTTPAWQPPPASPGPATVGALANPMPAVIPGAPRSVPRLRALPPPDRLEFALPAGHCCVITDDGGPTAALLAMTLQERGWPTVVLRFPTTLVPARPPLPPQVSRALLRDASEEHLAQTMRDIAESYGPIGAFFHLHPRPGNPGDTLFDPTDAALVRQVFLLARSLGATLRAAAEQGRSCLLTVTRMDGALGTAQRGDYSAAAGGLPGLVKTLRHEWPGVFCRAVDLSPEIGAAEAVRLIVAEAHDPDRLPAEVGYGRDGRVTLEGG